MKKVILLLIILTWFSSHAVGQNLDSLWKVYNYANQADTNRLKAIHEIVRSFIDSKPDTAIILAEQELKFAQTTKQKKFEAKALNAIGVAFANRKDSSKTIEFYLKALKLREEIGDLEGINQSYENITSLYEALGNFSKVLEFRFKQLKTLEIIDKSGIGNCYNEIGNFYLDHYNFPKALEYYLKTYSLAPFGFKCHVSSFVKSLCPLGLRVHL